MKELIRTAAAWAAMICIIPAAASGISMAEPAEAEEASAEYTAPRQPQEFSLETDMIGVYNEETGEISYISAEEYTAYALLAEIPYIMDSEAMKAQAVAARTYAVRRIISGSDDAIGGAHISTDGEKYQICLTDAEARAVYGADYEKALAAAESAAKATEGQILIYESSPIIAAFHTSSAGMTESAENVWGISEPYLTAVPSEGDLTSPYYNNVKTFTKAEISARIKADYPGATDFDGVMLTEVSPSGTVISADLCGITLSGARLAEILSFDSAAFSAEYTDSTVTFTVNGCGHLAGMSMYGADHMARQGADYEEILSHYYSGAEICRVL